MKPLLNGEEIMQIQLDDYFEHTVGHLFEKKNKEITELKKKLDEAKNSFTKIYQCHSMEGWMMKKIAEEFLKQQGG